MKYFIVSDIHSYYDELMSALEINNFDINNHEHILISCGDVWDRGPNPIKVMEFLMDLQERKRAVLIRGNHEDMLEECLARGYYYDFDVTNGTLDTIYHLAYYVTREKRSKTQLKIDFDDVCHKIKRNKKINSFLDSMVNFYELDGYIFTHGFIPIEFCYGFPQYKENWKESSSSQWKEARFYNGIELCSEYKIKIPNKIIVVGHFHASYGNIRKDHGFNIDSKKAYDLEFSNLELFKPYCNDGIIAIDSCVAYTKFINCIVIEIV